MTATADPCHAVSRVASNYLHPPAGRVERQRGEGLSSPKQSQTLSQDNPDCPSPRLGSTLPRESKVHLLESDSAKPPKSRYSVGTAMQSVAVPALTSHPSILASLNDPTFAPVGVQRSS
jgi:hypothetical protein